MTKLAVTLDELFAMGGSEELARKAAAEVLHAEHKFWFGVLEAGLMEGAIRLRYISELRCQLGLGPSLDNLTRARPVFSRETDGATR